MKLLKGSLLILCATVLVIAVFFLVTWDISHCYSVPLKDFYRQAELIRPGMTEKEAIERIKDYTQIKRHTGGMTFTLRPNRSPWIGIAVNQHIELKFNHSGRVNAVNTHDG
jgi:P2-related tail formation protein